uniref:3-hydroxy-3-methylglutaryl coenzyme A reductase n=1 Tax=Hemiselmis andersenii TaxID=464988 RepID=A0A6U2EQV5_HEMAN
MSGPGLEMSDAASMIENVITTFKLPMGVSLNMTINGKDYVVPMVVEEPSVVAAVSNVARMTRPEGFRTSSTEPVMIGQLHVHKDSGLPEAKAKLEASFGELVDLANSWQPRLVKRGGGIRGMEAKLLTYDEPGEQREETMCVYFYVDCRDAMGANLINTTAEKLAPEVERITGGRVGLKILSNLADRRLARAEVTLPFDRLATGTMDGREVAEGVASAYRFAYADPYRAATHNKGVMNGIDPVVIATGNDWRAIEAGAHAYAARSGVYRPLGRWVVRDGALHGSIELPMQVGIVGGTIRSHPTAKAALGMLEVESASHLGEIIAAVGLAQNLGALRALATEGIQRGHMSMHARSVVARVLAGESEEVRQKVYAEVVRSGDVKEEKVLEVFAALKAK